MGLPASCYKDDGLVYLVLKENMIEVYGDTDNRNSLNNMNRVLNTLLLPASLFLPAAGAN